MKKSLIFHFLISVCHFAVAAETYQAEVHTPVTGITITKEYTPSRADFEQEAKSKAAELRNQPNGGPAWINRSEQPRVMTTETTTLKGDVGGFGASISHQKPPLTQSADEAALNQVQRR